MARNILHMAEDRAMCDLLYDKCYLGIVAYESLELKAEISIYASYLTLVIFTIGLPSCLPSMYSSFLDGILIFC